MVEKNVAGASGSGTLGWVLGALAGAGIAVAAWYVGFRSPAPKSAPEPAPVAAPQADPQAATESAPEAVAAAPATPVPAPDAAAPAGSAPTAGATAPESVVAPGDATAPTGAAPEVVAQAPTFDTVRVDADGATLVAGRAADGAAVSILVDGAETASAQADRRGAFAALFTLPPSDRPRVMRLVAVVAGGAPVMSEAEVIIAPFALPVPPAEVAPTAEATPEVGAPTATAPAGSAGPTVLIVDQGSVRKETPAAPAGDIVIDTIGYGAEGAIEITGRGAAEAFARLYLDNAEQVTEPIGETGVWTARLSDVAPGLHTLRVDQVDAAGKVTSRFETPFQRETPETVMAALPATAAAPSPATTRTAPAEPPSAAALPAIALPKVAPEMTAGGASGIAPAGQAPATGAFASVPEVATPATKAVIVTVQPGYSLWRIARENYGEGILYVKVFEANKDQIRDPDLIYPGQIFTVPAQE